MDNTPIETGLSQQGIGTGIETGVQGSGWYQAYKQHEDGPGLESPGFLDYLRGVGSNELKSLTSDPLGYAGDLIAAPVRGAVDAAMGVYGLADWVTADLLPDWKDNPLGASHTAVGGLVQGISNFAVGFVPVVGWMGKLGTAAKASKIGAIAKTGSFLEAAIAPAESLTTTGAKLTHYLSKDLVGGAVTSAVVFRGDQERLSNLLTQIDNPLLNNAVTQYLAADPKDGEIEGRFKNAIEGMVAGPVMDMLLLGLKAIKGPRDILARGGSEAAALRARNGVVNSSEFRGAVEDAARMGEEAAPRPAEAAPTPADELTQVFDVSDVAAKETQPTSLEEQLSNSVQFRGKRGGEAVINRANMEASLGRLSGDDASFVSNFIRRIGKPLANTGFSIRRLPLTQAGTFDFAQDVITIARRVANGGGDFQRTFVHEVWHSLTRYLDDGTISAIDRDLAKARKAFAREHGLDPNNLTAKQIKEVAQAKRLDKEVWYRLTDRDEWLAETLTDATFNRLDLEDGTKTVVGFMRYTVQNLLTWVKSKFGGGTYDRVAKEWLDGRYSNLEAKTSVISDSATNRLFNTEVGGVASDIQPTRVLNAEGVKSPSDAQIVGDQARQQDAQPSSTLSRMSETEQLNLQKLASAINTGMVNVGGSGGTTGMTVEESIKALKLDRVFFGEKYLDANGQVIASEKDAATVLAQAMQGAQGAQTVPQAITLQQGIEQAQKMFNLDNRSLGQLLNTLADKQIDIRTYLTAGKFIEDLRAKTVAEKIREFNGHQAEVDRLRAAGDVAGAAEAEKKGIEAARQSIEAGLNIDKLARANAKLASEVGRTLNILNMKPGQVKAKLAELSNLHQGQLGTRRLELLKPSELRTELERLNLIAEFGPDALRAYEETFKGAGRYAKAAYESWIQSLLWAPKTWVSNGTALFQAVFKPLESALGQAMIGNFEEAAHAATLSYKWASYLGEAWWYARKAFNEERPIMGSKSFADTPGELGAINAEFLGIDHPVAAGLVNAYGRTIRTPSRLMLLTDEYIKQAVARSYAEQALLKQGLERVKLGTMDMSQLKNFQESSMKELFMKNGRLYSEQAVRDAAITEATSRGLKPNDVEFKKFVADYVEKNFNPSLGAVGDKARSYAEEITWQKELGNEGGIERLGNWINSGKNNLPILKLIFPFVRTPANLMIWVKDRSPLGIPKMWKDFSSGNPARKAEAVGRLTSMAGFMTVAMASTAAGQITGRGPSDPEQRRALMDTGWQPYSVKLGDAYVSYLRADPFSTLMGIVADLTDASQNTYNETQLGGDTQRVMAGLLSSMARSVTEKTFMAGLSLWSDVLSGEPNAAAKLFRNYAGSAIPFSGLMNSVVPQFDGDMKQLRSLTDAVMAKVPGLSNQVEPYRNLFGDPLKKPIAYAGLFGGVVDPANPFPVTWASNDPVKGEIARLNYGFNQPTPTMRNGEIDLRAMRNAQGQSAYDRWQELHGQTKINGKGLYDSLGQLIKSKSYQRMPADTDNQADSPRVDAVRMVVSRFRKRAQEQMLREFPQVAEALQRSVQNEYRMKIGLTPQ